LAEEEGSRLSQQELVSVAMELTIGGHDTTAKMSAAGPGLMNDGNVSAAARERLNAGSRSTDWPAW
jgi:cytochrome P450